MFILGGFGAYFSPLDSKLFSASDISIFDRFTTVLGLVWFSAVVGYILDLGCLDFLGVRFFMSWSIFLVRLLCSVCFMLSMFPSRISGALLAVRVSCCLNSVVNALISLSRVLHLSKWCSFSVFKNFSSACFVICFHLLCSFVVGPFAWGCLLSVRVFQMSHTFPCTPREGV